MSMRPLEDLHLLFFVFFRAFRGSLHVVALPGSLASIGRFLPRSWRRSALAARPRTPNLRCLPDTEPVTAAVPGKYGCPAERFVAACPIFAAGASSPRRARGSARRDRCSYKG